MNICFDLVLMWLNPTVFDVEATFNFIWCIMGCHNSITHTHAHNILIRWRSVVFIFYSPKWILCTFASKKRRKKLINFKWSISVSEIPSNPGKNRSRWRTAHRRVQRTRQLIPLKCISYLMYLLASTYRPYRRDVCNKANMLSTESFIQVHNKTNFHKFILQLYTCDLKMGYHQYCMRAPKLSSYRSHIVRHHSQAYSRMKSHLTYLHSAVYRKIMYSQMSKHTHSLSVSLSLTTTDSFTFTFQHRHTRAHINYICIWLNDFHKMVPLSFSLYIIFWRLYSFGCCKKRFLGLFCRKYDRNCVRRK